MKKKTNLLHPLQVNAEDLQKDLDQLVLTLLIDINQRTRRAHEDLRALFHVFDFELVTAISDEIEAVDQTAISVGPKIDRAHSMRDLARLLKQLIVGANDELKTELEKFRTAVTLLKNIQLLSIVLDLLVILKEVDRLERKFAI